MALDMIRLGLIGTGRVAHAHLRAISSLPNRARLVAVCDEDIGKARSVAEQYGCNRVFSHYQDLAADPEIDAAIVCLPTHLHHPVGMDLSRAGKHVLVEKPMSMTVDQAGQMIEEANRNRVILMVGQCRRFSRAIDLVRERLPELGRVFRIDISFLVRFPSPQTTWWSDRRKTGPLVIPLQGSHSIDTVVWLLDKTPASVYADVQLFNPEFGSADEASIALHFESGEIASIQLSLNTAPYVHETIIAGSKGCIRMYEYPTEEVYGFRNRVVLNDELLLDAEESPSLYNNQLTEFLVAITEGREPRASGSDIMRTMIVLDAACLSADSGKVVRI